ncbi:uncharacterized protein LOC116308958, partial [Actinia tenebrosa]|uniref:Uncharacterized protein LOC116308958 n=1 Tax=Actinia tenebrosa TaxID=6105 RepID=A0A6P8J5E1_ACTTE
MRGGASFQNGGLDLVQVIGKRGRKVPIILTSDVKNAIDVLISKREQVGVSTKNKYVFARANQDSQSYARGWESMKKTLSCVGNLERPELITSTKLRKYIATVAQVGSLTENDMDWLARHLGHDISIHRQYYRLHESTLELAKVSKLLLAVDAGNIENLVGRSLSDINVDDISERPKNTGFEDDDSDDDNDDIDDEDNVDVNDVNNEDSSSSGDIEDNTDEDIDT